MPCDNPDHTHHSWPVEGTLVIEKCEHYCDFCEGPDGRGQHWKFPWFLRRHVKTVHAGRGDLADLVVSDGWPEKPDGMAKTPKSKSKSPASDKQSGANRVRKPKAQRPITPSINKMTIATHQVAPVAPMMDHSRDSGVDLCDHDMMADRDSDSDIVNDEMAVELYSGGGVDDPVFVPADNKQAPDPLEFAFREAVKDLIQQGISGGLKPLNLALAMADELDRLEVNPCEVQA